MVTQAEILAGRFSRMFTDEEYRVHVFEANVCDECKGPDHDIIHEACVARISALMQLLHSLPLEACDHE
jgi:hypothetical protein